MAKKLANLFAISEKGAIACQQKYNWLHSEYDALPSEYQQKKEKQLSKFIKRCGSKYFLIKSIPYYITKDIHLPHLFLHEQLFNIILSNTINYICSFSILVNID